MHRTELGDSDTWPCVGEVKIFDVSKNSYHSLHPGRKWNVANVWYYNKTQNCLPSKSILE